MAELFFEGPTSVLDPALVKGLSQVAVGVRGSTLGISGWVRLSKELCGMNGVVWVVMPTLGLAQYPWLWICMPILKA